MSTRSRLYVGRLSSRTRERDLNETFGRYGRVTSCELKGGYGFVEFSNYHDAEDAVRGMDNTSLDGSRILVEFSKGPRPGRKGPPTRSEYRLVIENIPRDMSWQDLKDHFRRAGDVVYADVNSDRGGKPKGVVEYKSREDMKRAIRDMDDTEIRGSVIRVREDEQRKSRSRSRSRSPRRRRSRSPRGSPRRRSPRGRRSRSPPRRHSRSKSPRRSRERNDRDDKSRSSNGGGGGSSGGGGGSGNNGSRSTKDIKERSPSPTSSKGDKGGDLSVGDRDRDSGRGERERGRKRSRSPTPGEKEKRSPRGESRSPSPKRARHNDDDGNRGAEGAGESA